LKILLNKQNEYSCIEKTREMAESKTRDRQAAETGGGRYGKGMHREQSNGHLGSAFLSEKSTWEARFSL
jgi:hypothetical protein